MLRLYCEFPVSMQDRLSAGICASLWDIVSATVCMREGCWAAHLGGKFFGLSTPRRRLPPLPLGCSAFGSCMCSSRGVHAACMYAAAKGDLV